VGTPLASIIIPVGARHAPLAATAVASCQWQSVTSWEAVVVNDTGADLRLPDDPRVRVIGSGWTGGNRASVARNAGIAHARGTFVVFLDADDYLLPHALRDLIRGHTTHDAAYTYGNHYVVAEDGPHHLRPLPYTQAFYARFNLHPITALIPRACVVDVGGFDEGAPGFEDWTLYLRLAQAGHCGAHVPAPVFVYRHEHGTQHQGDAANAGPLMAAIRDRYRGADGEIRFMGCGCSGGAQMAKQVARAAGVPPPEIPEGSMLLRFTGRSTGSQTFVHPTSRRQYRAGANPAREYVTVEPDDLAWLLSLGVFERVAPPTPFMDPPKPALPPDAPPVLAGAPEDDAPAPAPKKVSKK